MDLQVILEEITLAAPLPDVFATFLSLPDPIFLDSSLAHPHLGRYSYIAAAPLVTITAKKGRVAIRPNAGQLPRTAQRLFSAALHDESHDPFVVLQRLLRAGRSQGIQGLPPFQGGALGYFGYDLAHHLEALPSNAVDDLGLPDIYVGLYPWVLAHDQLSNRTWLIVNAVEDDLAAAEGQLRDLRRVVASVGREANEQDRPPRRLKLSASFTKEGYLQTIAAAKAYIAAGDIYEICLSQRFAVEIAEHPWRLYRRLRGVSPVPFGAYLGLPEAAVVSASPELFLRLRGGRVETRPIKGTRPRGTTPELDRRLAAELRASEKEQAENLMIVDLLRNDLGRVCRIGSVKVPELFAVESYSTVHQMVSTVQGELRGGLDAIDLLRACFPGGSVTGCPKIRAMEIIDELEPTQRGVYCGSIGFIGFNGDMDTSIVIRTIVVKDNMAYLQVGGAIVADSEPAAEYQETLDKAQAGLLAISGTRRGSEALAGEEESIQSGRRRATSRVRRGDK